MPKARFLLIGVLLVLSIFVQLNPVYAAPPPQNPQSGSVGLQGEIPANPPTQGATITVPGNGQNFTTVPITVAGICPKGLLVEIYKNGVFSGSTDCTNGGSFSLQIDLFDGRNDLVAKVYDDLNQAGPDSNTVTVNFNALKPSTGPRISLTTEFAKRGALPGSTLDWPISISGGTPPYAISVDWGDQTTPDLISHSTPGNLTLEHIYKSSGVYKVTIKGTDANGQAAFLQVVGIGNGPIQQTNPKNNTTTNNVFIEIIWWPLLVMLALMVIVFWLGKRQEIQQIRTRIRKGQKPF